MERNSTVPAASGSAIFWSALVWLIAFFIARAGLELRGLDTWARVALAVLPVLPFVAFLSFFIAGIRSMDELERRIHLEALAFAFPVTVVLLMTLGLLELAISLPKEDLSYRHVWAFMPVLYFGGVALSRRRYQ